MNMQLMMARARMNHQASTGSGDPYWANVVALMHFDGTQGSTTMVDSSSYHRALTPAGNAHIDTTQSVFGGASLLLDGSGAYVTSPPASGLVIGTQEFTFEGWLRTSVKDTAILDMRPSSTTGIFFGVAAATGYLQAFINAGTTINAFGTVNICDGAWHAFAYSCAGSGGSRTLRFFVDGVPGGSVLLPNDINSGSMLNIGQANTGAVRFNGYADELRLTIGKGRYLTDYTPSPVPFPNHA